MSGATFSRRCLTAVAAAGAALLTVGVAASSAAPSSDGQGYLDSTARCDSAKATVLFGSTDASRIAICSMSDGSYEYRGVRLRDGAKLIVPATRGDDGAYTAENAGIEYMVTSKSLVLSSGVDVIREESMVDFHGPSSATATTPATTQPAKPLPPPLPAEVGGSGRS